MISFTLALQHCKNGEGEMLYPWMSIDCLSCALKPLFTKFIRDITAYGALIISIVPVTCHGSSVSSLLLFKPTLRGVYCISQRYKPHFIPSHRVAFQLERQRRI